MVYRAPGVWSTATRVRTVVVVCLQGAYSREYAPKLIVTRFQNFYTTTVDAFTVYGSGEMSIIQGPDTENDVSTTHSSALNANFLFYYDCYT